MPRPPCHRRHSRHALSVSGLPGLLGLCGLLVLLAAPGRLPAARPAPAQLQAAGRPPAYKGGRAGASFQDLRAKATARANGSRLTAASDCLLGNLNLAVHATDDWIWGNETYAYFIDPTQVPACLCPDGFQLDQLHVTLQFGPEDVPVSFGAAAGLAKAVWDGNCWVPGLQKCVSATQEVQIATPGIYDVIMPVSGECPCVKMNRAYFLTFSITSPFPEFHWPGVMTDGLPIGCTSYNDWGFGWEDLVVLYGFQGELLIWADVTCCDVLVPVESSTWGTVKSLYR